MIRGQGRSPNSAGCIGIGPTGERTRDQESSVEGRTRTGVMGETSPVITQRTGGARVGRKLGC